MKRLSHGAEAFFRGWGLTLAAPRGPETRERGVRGFGAAFQDIRQPAPGVVSQQRVG